MAIPFSSYSNRDEQSYSNQSGARGATVAIIHPMGTIPLSPLIILVTGPLLLAACSDSGPTPSTSPADPPQAAPAVVTTPLSPTPVPTTVAQPSECCPVLEGYPRLVPTPTYTPTATPTPTPTSTPLPTDTQSLLAILEGIEEAVRAAEEFEAAGTTLLLDGDPTYDEQQELTEQLERSAPVLAAYIGQNHDDVDALVLQGRLLRAHAIMTSLDAKLAQIRGDLDPEGLMAQMQTPLDRVLDLEPDNAEAHYWKGRLYGIGDPFGLDGEHLEKAVHFGKLAVALAPENLAYREALAIYLFTAQRLDEALDVFLDVGAEDHHMYQLLADHHQVPLPEGALLDRSRTQAQADRHVLRPRLSQTYPHPSLRFPVYWVAQRASEIEAFYQGHWPSFKLVDVEGSAVGSGFAKTVASPFRPRQSQPATTYDSDLDVLIVVIEAQVPAWAQARLSSDSVISQIIIMNFRKYGPEDP